MTQPRSRSRRRDFLKTGAAFAALGALPTTSWAGLPLLPKRKTKRAVLVVFGGGVRSRETLGSGNTPNLDRIAEQGVLLPKVSTQNIGHYGATVSILTGSYETFGIRENARPDMPTLFEQLRKSAGMGASEVWLSTSGSDQETNYAYSTARGYGAPYGANLIGGEGIFNEEFKQLLAGKDGIPRPDPERDATVDAMRQAVRTPIEADGAGESSLNDAASAAQVESYILQELRGSTAAITGIGAEDAKAVNVARTLLNVFRPKLLGVTLRTADVAHDSYNDYVTVIKRNDEELGKLFDVIQGNPELRDSTALFVMPEFGRDRDFNARRGLDHGDSSDELLKVSLVAWGPDFKQGKVQNNEIRTIDLAPTVIDLLGGRPGKGGSVIRSLFA